MVTTLSSGAYPPRKETNNNIKLLEYAIPPATLSQKIRVHFFMYFSKHDQLDLLKASKRISCWSFRKALHQLRIHIMNKSLIEPIHLSTYAQA